MLIVYLCCAVVFLAVGLLALKHKAYRTNLPLFLVLWLLFLGFAVGSLSLLWHKTDTYALLFGALAIGMAICVVAVMNIRAAFVCDVPLEGVYQGFVEYPGIKGQNALAPVFEYDYEGKHYRVQSAQSYPEKHLLFDMTPEDRYPIYIEAAHPENVILHKRVPAANIALLIAGVALIVVGILSVVV